MVICWNPQTLAPLKACEIQRNAGHISYHHEKDTTKNPLGERDFRVWLLVWYELMYIWRNLSLWRFSL